MAVCVSPSLEGDVVRCAIGQDNAALRRLIDTVPIGTLTHSLAHFVVDRQVPYVRPLCIESFPGPDDGVPLGYDSTPFHHDTVGVPYDIVQYGPVVRPGVPKSSVADGLGPVEPEGTFGCASCPSPTPAGTAHGRNRSTVHAPEQIVLERHPRPAEVCVVGCPSLPPRVRLKMRLPAGQVEEFFAERGDRRPSATAPPARSSSGTTVSASGPIEGPGVPLPRSRPRTSTGSSPVRARRRRPVVRRRRRRRRRRGWGRVLFRRSHPGEPRSPLMTIPRAEEAASADVVRVGWGGRREERVGDHGVDAALDGEEGGGWGCSWVGGIVGAG